MKEFPPFRLDLVNQCLWRRSDGAAEQRIVLPPTAFAMLRYLVEHAGRLVKQDELLDALWPDTFVQPEVLKGHIREIRSVLCDDAKNARFIETLPRRGYQFIASVTDDSCKTNLEADSPASRLVGRNTELEQLRGSLRRALHGERQLVFVTGEPGIGKTALVDEFQRQAAADTSGLRMARGQCVEGYGGKEPYYPILEALGQLCHGPAADSVVVQVLAAQAPTWLVQFPALVKRERREMLQREILGATRERMLREIADALETITSENPLLLVFEDLHWADQSTVDLISALGRRRQSARLMLIGTYRLVDLILSEHPLKAVKQDLLVHQLCRKIELEPLEEAAVAEYLAAESGDADVPEGLARLIHRHSEGNPLFMVATLEHMTQRGFISRENEQWKFNVPRGEIDLEVPEILQQMIEAQIDRLRPEEQRVLEVASVESIGRSRFAVASRASLIDIEPEAFEDVCEALSRRHRIVRSAGSQKFSDGTVSACYEFVHVLYREVCYRRIAPGHRAQMHRRIGQWAEAHPLGFNQDAAWLAGHFEQGGDWLRAIKYLQLAADTAGRRLAFRQAAEILERALELVSKLPEASHAASEREILEKLAILYNASWHLPGMMSKYEELVARAARSGLIDVEVCALIDMAFPISFVNAPRCLEVVERAMQLSARQADPVKRTKARLRCLTARAWVAGWIPGVAEECRSAIEEIRRDGGRLELALHLIDYAYVQFISSEYREAHRSATESRSILTEASGENLFASIQDDRNVWNLIWSLTWLGQWGEALRHLQAGFIREEKNENRRRAVALQLDRALLHLHAHDFVSVASICESSLPFVRDWIPVLRRCQILAGSADVALGNHQRGLESLMTARDAMDRQTVMSDWYQRMLLELGLTELWLAKGDLAQAKSHAQQLLELASATAERTWQALAWEVNARVAMAELDLTRAQDCIAKGLSAMEGFEVPLAAWRVHATASELYDRMGEQDSAAEHCELSRATIMKLANSLPAEEPLRRTFLSASMVRKILGDSKIAISLATHA